MSCNTCQAKFSLFTKDIGCSMCGLSYCKKCLKYKCDIPNVGRKKVCGPCYNKLSNMSKSSPEDAMNDAVMSDANEKFAMTDDIVMKLDSLENPAKPPIVMYKHTNHWDKLKKGLEPADQQIVDRLQKLKGNKQKHPLPTDDEIKQRLALLKDQDPEANSSKTINIHQRDNRTNQQQAEDLLQEYYEQLQLSSTNDPYKEIQDRLVALHEDDDTYFNRNKRKDIKNLSVNIMDDDSDDDGDDEVKSVNKLIASLKLQQIDDLSEESDISSISDSYNKNPDNSSRNDKTI